LKVKSAGKGIPDGYFLKYLTQRNIGPYSHYKFPKVIKLGWRTPRTKKIARCRSGWHFSDIAASSHWAGDYYQSSRVCYVVRVIGKHVWWRNNRYAAKGAAKQLEFVGKISRRGDINRNMLDCIQKYERNKRRKRLLTAKRRTSR